MKLAQPFWNLVRLKIAIKRWPRTTPNFFNAGLTRSRSKQTEWTKRTSFTKTCAQNMIQFFLGEKDQQLSPGEKDQARMFWVVHQHLILISLCREKDWGTTKRWGRWRRMGFYLPRQKQWIWRRMVNHRWIGLNKAHSSTAGLLYIPHTTFAPSHITYTLTPF